MKLQNPMQERTCCPAFDQFCADLNNFNLQNRVARQSGASLQEAPSDTSSRSLAACCPAIDPFLQSFLHFCRHQLQGSIKLLCRELGGGRLPTWSLPMEQLCTHINL